MVIGIYGKAGSGKDTLLKFINEELASRNVKVVRGRLKNSFYNPFERIAFADKLKQVCSLLTDLPLDWFHNREKYTYVIPVIGLTIREFMQKVGEGLRKTVHEDIWLLPIERVYHTGRNWVIVDIRHQNEFNFVEKRLKGFTIKIERPNHSEKTLTSEESKKHASETALDLFDNGLFSKHIVNTSLEHLREQAREIVDTYETDSKKDISWQNLD